MRKVKTVLEITERNTCHDAALSTSLLSKKAPSSVGADGVSGVTRPLVTLSPHRFPPHGFYPLSLTCFPHPPWMLPPHSPQMLPTPIWLLNPGDRGSKGPWPLWPNLSFSCQIRLHSWGPLLCTDCCWQMQEMIAANQHQIQRKMTNRRRLKRSGEHRNLESPYLIRNAAAVFSEVPSNLAAHQPVHMFSPQSSFAIAVMQIRKSSSNPVIFQCKMLFMDTSQCVSSSSSVSKAVKFRPYWIAHSAFGSPGKKHKRIAGRCWEKDRRRAACLSVCLVTLHWWQVRQIEQRVPCAASQASQPTRDIYTYIRKTLHLNV